MAHDHIESQVDRLEQRVRRLEGGRAVRNPLITSSATAPRLLIERLGWFLVGVALLPLFFTWATAGSTNIFLSLLLSVGVVLILITRENLLGESDSTTQLRHEQRAAASPASALLHLTPRQRRRRLGGVAALDTAEKALFLGAFFLVVAYTITVTAFSKSETVQAMLLIAGAFAGYLAACQHSHRATRYGTIVTLYAALALNRSLSVSVPILTFLCFVLLYQAWQQRDRVQHLLITMGSYLVLLRWLLSFSRPGHLGTLIPLSFWRDEWLLLNVATVLMSTVLIIPFISGRRVLADRVPVRGIFLANGLGFAAMMAGLSSVSSETNQLATNLAAYVLLCGALGVVSWLSDGRMSYARSFYGSGFGLLALIGVSSFNPFLTVGWCFALTAAAMLAGFWFTSVTARQLGYLFAASTTVYYLLFVLPLYPYLSDPALRSSILAFGSLIAILLLTTTYWIRTVLPATANEWRYRGNLIPAADLTGFFLLFTVAGISLEGVPFIFTWVLLALLLAWRGQRTNTPLFAAISEGMLICTLLWLIVTGNGSVPLGAQVALYSTFGVALLIVGWLIATRPAVIKRGAHRAARTHLPVQR